MNLRDPLSDHKRNRLEITTTEPLWTVEEVADYLRLKQETVRIMARGRKIPAIKVGKVWRFKVSDIKDMLVSKSGRGK